MRPCRAADRPRGGSHGPRHRGGTRLSRTFRRRRENCADPAESCRGCTASRRGCAASCAVHTAGREVRAASRAGCADCRRPRVGAGAVAPSRAESVPPTSAPAASAPPVASGCAPVAPREVRAASCSGCAASREVRAASRSGCAASCDSWPPAATAACRAWRPRPSSTSLRPEPNVAPSGRWCTRTPATRLPAHHTAGQHVGPGRVPRRAQRVGEPHRERRGAHAAGDRAGCATRRAR